jgi:hypothetical protein
MTGATAAPTNVVEYIRSLSDEDKDAAILELVEHAIRVNGNKYTIPVRKRDGGLLAYFVPAGPAESILRCRVPDLTPEQQASTQAAIDNLDNTFDVEKWLNEASREDQGSS